MEAVKVLSVDQQAGSRTDAPKVAKTVTLETDTAGAQQLALASDVGRLSLLLRGAGDKASASTQKITLGGAPESNDAESENEDQAKGGLLSFLTPKEQVATETTIKVVRGDEVREAVVPIQKQINQPIKP